MTTLEFLEEQIPMLLNDDIPLADKQAEIGAYITVCTQEQNNIRRLSLL